MPNLTHIASEVYLRPTWSGEWELQPFLDAQTAAFRCSPSMPTATMRYKFGRVAQRGELQASHVEPLDVMAQFVKIVINPGESERRWYGIIVESEQDLGGISEGVRYGVQKLTAYGMEYLLARTTVTKTYLQPLDSSVDTVIERAMGFNMGAGDGHAGELGPNSGGADSQSFDIELSGIFKWTPYDIVKYLIDRFQPTDQAGNVVVDFQVKEPTTGLSNMQIYSPPTLAAEGRAVKELLDQLADRRRMLSWRCAVSDDESYVAVEILNHLENPVALPGDQGTLEANDRQVSWNFDTDNTIRECRLVHSDVPQVTEVICRGDRMTSTFTMFYNASLDRGWSTDQKDQYLKGASEQPGYGGLEQIAKQFANRQAREALELRPVFRHFRVPVGWDGIAGDVIAKHPLTDERLPLAVEAMRPIQTLMLREQIDYTTVDDSTRAAHERSKTDYHRPLALALVDGVQIFLDRADHNSFATLPEAAGRDWAAHVRPLEDAPGVEIVVSGKPAHVLASGEFTPVDDADAADEPVDVDWKHITLTITMLVDAHCEARWPNPPDVSDSIARRVYIYVPNARLDYLVPNTVIGLGADNATKKTSGGYVRDDRPRLQALARIAFDWYGFERRAVAIAQHGTTTFTGDVGSMLTAIGGNPGDPDAIDIFTVVTEMIFDLVAGTTAIKTDFAELDVGKL